MDQASKASLKQNFKIDDGSRKSDENIVPAQVETLAQYGLERCTSQLQTEDIRADIFEQIVGFTRRKELTIHNCRNAWDIIFVCRQYVIPNLMEKCLSYIMNNFTLDTVLLSYEFSRFHNFKGLMDMYFRRVLMFTKDFMCTTFHMELSTLKAILKEERLNATESDLFILVVMWVKDECTLSNVTPSIDNIWKFICDEKLLDNINVHAFNFSLYQFTEYMLTIPCYARINDVVGLIKILLNEKITETITITGRTPTSGYYYRCRLMDDDSRSCTISEDVSLLTIVSVPNDTDTFLLGLALTIMRPLKATYTVYGIKIDICISIMDDLTWVPYYNARFMSNACTSCYGQDDNSRKAMVEFAVPVRLEGREKYSLTVTYYNTLPSGKAEIDLRYGSEFLTFNGTKVIEFTNELLGSVIYGAALIKG